METIDENPEPAVETPETVVETPEPVFEEEEKPRLEEEKIQSVLESFLQKTTIHGIYHMVSEDNKLRRIIWLIILLLSLGFLVFFIIYTVLNYLKLDVIGNLKVIIEVSMEIPTLTICNMNSYRSNVNYTIDQMLLYCEYENTVCDASYFVEFPISTYKCYSFNSGRNRSGHKMRLLKTSKKGYSYVVSLKLFAGFPEEANLYTNGFLVFVQ